MIVCRPAHDPEQAVRMVLAIWGRSEIATPDVVTQAAQDYQAAVERSRDIPEKAPTGTSVLERAEHAVNASTIRREARRIAEADLKEACREVRDRLQAAAFDTERLLVDHINSLLAQADKAAEDLPQPLPEDTLANGWNRAVLTYIKTAPRGLIGELRDLEARVQAAVGLRESLAKAGFHACNATVAGTGGGYVAWALISAPGTPRMPGGDGRRMPEALGLVGHRISVGAEAVRAVTTAASAEVYPRDLVAPYYPRWGG